MFIVRRFQGETQSNPLQVVGRVALTPKHAIHLLRNENRILLIGTGPQAAPTFLGEWSVAPDSTLSSATASTSTPGAPDAVATFSSERATEAKECQR